MSILIRYTRFLIFKCIHQGVTMKKIIAILLAGILSVSAFADNNELASQAIKIGFAKVTAAPAGGNTHAYMHFTNTSDDGHTIIAAMSPDAMQAQLHTFVTVQGKPVEVLIHSLPIEADKYLYLSKKRENIALLGLNKALSAGTKTPITVIYRDGSYQTVQADVVSS